VLQKPTVKGFVETTEQDVEMLFEIIYLDFSTVLHGRSTNGIGHWIICIMQLFCVIIEVTVVVVVLALSDLSWRKVLKQKPKTFRCSDSVGWVTELVCKICANYYYYYY